MDSKGQAWQQADLAKLFLEDVRGGIPLAAEQIDVLRRVVRYAAARVDRLLDLGCGDGILGRTVMADYPAADGVFLDFSEHMIAAAKQKADVRRATFIVQDLATSEWRRSVAAQAPFDLVLSGLAIHHLPDERKRALYQEVFRTARPGRAVSQPGTRGPELALGQAGLRRSVRRFALVPSSQARRREEQG